MDFLNLYFPVSGVTANVLIPPLVSLVISFFTSMGGISGAFLLLPFQMSYLNYTAPSVSGTNHVFNIIAIPSGVYRYIKEGRMFWPLTWVVIAGTLPGVFIGYFMRVLLLPDPKTFKLFAGCVLLYIGIRLFREMLRRGETGSVSAKSLEEKTGRITGVPGTEEVGPDSGLPRDASVKTISVSLHRVQFEFRGERFSFNTAGMFFLAFLVGIVGGAYGIGGGAIIAPFCVAYFRLPVYTIAGATLMGTFMTSFAGALFFSLIPGTNGISATPDWLLGILFGSGGLIGMYLGARAQKFVPQKFIKIIIGTAILFIALKYIGQYAAGPG